MQGGIEFTPVALGIATPAQCESLAAIAERGAKVVVQHGGFDLPTGYLAFRLEYASGARVYGGVSPEGQVST